MRLSENEDPEEEVLSKLLQYESPFSWDMPEPDVPIDIYIRNLTDKCDVIEEENQFQWTRFIPHLILSYLLCEKIEDYSQALEHINWCSDHWNSIENKCKEHLFTSLRDVVPEVILATKAHILLASGDVTSARQKSDFLENQGSSIFRYQVRGAKIRRTAAVMGLKAAVHLQFGKPGFKTALALAKGARDLDPDQAEWWFITGNILGKIRRNNPKEDKNISLEEIAAIERAFTLQKDASYTAYLGQLYSDYSRYLHYDKDYDKSKTYAVKAASRFREALKMRPQCTYLKARVAHGMLRMHYCKEAFDMPLVKRLLEEVVSSSDHRAMAYADLALYYYKVEKNPEKAIEYAKKAFEIGSKTSVTFLASIKWKNGLEHEIIPDFEEGLTRYENEDYQALLLCYLGAYHVIIKDDWQSAISCFHKSLELDPSAQHFENFRGFNGRLVNLLELICNHLHFRETEENQTVKSFLTMVAQKKPQEILSERQDQFIIWKEELDKLRVCQPSKSEPDQQTAIEAKEISKNTQVEETSLKKILDLLQPMSKQIPGIQDELKNLATKEEVKLIAADVELMKEDVKSIDNKVEALEPRMTDAEKRLKDLESKVENLEKELSDRLSLEDVIGEINDRFMHTTSIILHNLPESDDESIQVKITRDKGLVSKICQAMEYNITMTEIRVNRIGKHTSGKCRPLMVTFKTAEKATAFWKMLSIESVTEAVKEFDSDLAEVRVVRYKTDRERQYLKKLRDEIQTRSGKNETLMIKYKNGIPEIVSKFKRT